MGYTVREEFASYGQRIGRIHIKDKLLAGPNVPLGSGVADFQALAVALRAIDYTGDYTLEVARSAVGDEVEYARQNRRFIVENILACRNRA
jgi:hexulose-6-phosphate isomerase